MISTMNPKVPNKYLSAKKTFIFLGRLCLVIAPFLSFIGWALPHDSISSFLQFNIFREATDATTIIDRTNPSEVFRYYLLPHYFIYVSMLFYAGSGIYLGYLIFRKTPWHAFIGSMFTVIGAIYFVGVLGTFLSIPMGTVNQTNILLISFGLCTFVFLGNLILGFGLFKTQIVPRINTILFIVGVILIIIFPGIENWMALGSLFMLIGVFPIINFQFKKDRIQSSRRPLQR